MIIEGHKIYAAVRLMEQCRANDDIHRRILGTGIELCLETLGIELNKKPLEPASNQGLKKVLLKLIIEQIERNCQWMGKIFCRNIDRSSVG